MTRHPLEEKWDTTAWDILSAIERGFRAQADVKGKLAELYLYRRLLELTDQAAIENLVWQDKDGRPDFVLTHGGRELRIECKNVRSLQNPKGSRGPRVELQKTRNNKDPLDPTRGYKPEEFRRARSVSLQLYRQVGISFHCHSTARQTSKAIRSVSADNAACPTPSGRYLAL
jgi:hypothetical protein